MGHIRLGRLYKSRKWNQVIDLLESNGNESQLTGAVLDATERQLRKLSHDPAIIHAFWLLVRITWAARSDDFQPFLSDIGIDLEDSASIFSLTSALSDYLQKKAVEYPESDVFTGLANLAFVDVITETIAERPRTLFGSNLEDIQNAFEAYSSKKQFGLISRRFFAYFLSRTIKYFLNKEISNHIGVAHRFENIQSAREFNNALTLYAYQSAKIMEDFAGGWYSKHNWEQRGQIRERDVSNFVAFALKKLRMELGQERIQELHQ